MISSDIHCIDCGYNLRGLGEEGACPECGRAIAESLRGDVLRYANRDWIDRVYRGAALASLGGNLMFVLFFVVCLPVFLTIGILETTGVLPDDGGVWMSVFATVATIALSIAFLLMPAGVWMLATPESRDLVESGGRAAFLRVSTICVLLAAPLWYVVVLFPFTPALDAVAHGCAAVVTAHLWLLLDHVERIERRCEGFAESRAPTLRRNRYVTFAVAAIVMAIHWDAFDLILSTAWTPPGEPLSWGIFVLLWMFMTSTLGITRRAIRDELTKPGRPAL